MYDSMHNKTLGNRGEQIAADRLEEQGRHILDRNRVMRGGEIDIIAQDGERVVFVEVKVVSNIDDLTNYITQRKIKTLTRAMENRLRQNKTPLQPRIDIILVEGDQVTEHIDNITLHYA